MPLPAFNEFGDLPEGKHAATLAEVIDRFGTGSNQRITVTRRLQRIFELAVATGRLDRLLIFGSYVTDVMEPHDVDVVLVMHNDFHTDLCPKECSVLFDHSRAHAELGASIFWIRPDLLLGEPLEPFLTHWQTKRDGRRRGTVEIRP